MKRILLDTQHTYDNQPYDCRPYHQVEVVPLRSVMIRGREIWLWGRPNQPVEFLGGVETLEDIDECSK